MKRIAKELERQNKTKEFVTAFIARDGFPIWNKSKIEKHKRKGNTQAFDGEGFSDTIVYIPLVVNAEQYVHGFLKAIVGDTIDLKIFRQNDYINFPFQTPGSSPNITTAENFAIRMMGMDKDVFGSTEFKVSDKRMFHNSTNYSDTANKQRFINIDSLNGESFANGTTVSNYQYELCYTIYTLTYICGGSFSGTGNNIEGNPSCWQLSSSKLCITFETSEGNGGEGGGSWPYIPGGGGGAPPGGGGGPPCVEFGGSIINGIVPINCEPGPGGNPWPPGNPQNYLDYIWLTYNVKDSTNNPCVASVLGTLRSISSKLPELLRSVFDTSGTNGFDVTFKMENLGTYEGGSTTHNFENFNYKVKVNSFFSDATDLSVASTIIHEIFHCQILAWFRQCYILGDTAKQRELVNKWGFLFTGEVSFDSSLAVIANGNGPTQHQAIAVRYNDAIGQALFEFAQAKGINVTLEYCKDLAWAGCTSDSRAFLELGALAKFRINQRINAEKDPFGSTANDPFLSPIGNPCL